MNRIFKYPLEVESRQLLTVPKGARFISVALQNDIPMLFAIVQETGEFEQRVVRTVTTGEEFGGSCEHVGTVIIQGWYTAHVFEQTVGVPGDSISDRFQNDMRQVSEELAAVVDNG